MIWRLCFQPPCSSTRAWTPHLNREMRHFAGRTRQTIESLLVRGAQIYQSKWAARRSALEMLHLTVDMTNEGTRAHYADLVPLDSALGH